MSLRDDLNRAFDEEWNGPARLAEHIGGITPSPIRVVQGELHGLVETAHEVLAERSPRLFQYGGVLVHAERLPQSLQVKGGVTVPANTIILEPRPRSGCNLRWPGSRPGKSLSSSVTARSIGCRATRPPKLQPVCWPIAPDGNAPC